MTFIRQSYFIYVTFANLIHLLSHRPTQQESHLSHVLCIYLNFGRTDVVVVVYIILSGKKDYSWATSDDTVPYFKWTRPTTNCLQIQSSLFALTISAEFVHINVNVKPPIKKFISPTARQTS